MNYQERREQQSLRTRNQIIDSAVKLMTEHGYDQVSIREICRAADVTTGAFYYHFPSKDALLLNCFSTLQAHLQSALDDGEVVHPVTRLKRLVTAYADYMDEKRPLLNKYYEYRLGNPELSASFDSDDYLRRTLEASMVQAQRAGTLPTELSAQQVASFLHLHYRGIVIEWLLTGKESSLRDLMLRDFDFFVAILT